MSEYIEHDRDENSVGIVEKKFFTFAEPPHEMVLESGAKLGPITLAYETCGTLNADKSNVILILHALSGDSHVAGYYNADDEKPGWWDNMVGPGKGIDTNKYFVICSNILGSCMGSTGPCTINPKTVLPYGLDFPVVTIGDMVAAQKALVDHLGIEKLLAVVGGSIGGMQLLEWCVRYPEMVAAGIPWQPRPVTPPWPSPLMRSAGRRLWPIPSGTAANTILDPSPIWVWPWRA